MEQRWSITLRGYRVSPNVERLVIVGVVLTGYVVVWGTGVVVKTLTGYWGTFDAWYFRLMDTFLFGALTWMLALCALLVLWAIAMLFRSLVDIEVVDE